ncbi:MAG: glycosyltransferase 87 family protein [Lachnospiraceae bacterium]|nr:glycosyltransferase 87 family protein [Lachnospiraceae bacterium]
MLNKHLTFFKKKLNQIIRIKPFSLYLILSLFSTVLFFLLMPFLGQHGFDWAVMENNSHFESADYFLCILFSLGKQNVYLFGIDACYSPLSYALFYWISKTTSMDTLLKGVNLLSIPYEELINMTSNLLISPYQLLAFIIYSIIGILLYVFAVDELNLTKRKKQLLVFSIIFSVPLLFGAVERGNLTMYVAAFVLIAFKLKDSPNPVKREIALILIAISAGLKFYPAFMGLLYLKEKRYKEAGRLIIYGILCVFVPFSFFGGLSGLTQLLNSLSALAIQNNYMYRIQFFKGVLTIFGIYGNLSNLLNTIFICVLIIFMMMTKNKTRMMTYLAAALAFYPPNAYRYTLLYFLLPLFTWIEEESQDGSISNYISAVLFSCIFSIPTVFGVLTHFKLNFNYYTVTYVEIFIYLAAWLFFGLQILYDIKDFSTMYHKKSKS